MENILVSQCVSAFHQDTHKQHWLGIVQQEHLVCYVQLQGDATCLPQVLILKMIRNKSCWLQGLEHHPPEDKVLHRMYFHHLLHQQKISVEHAAHDVAQQNCSAS
ncbi:hypothetical protein Pyn_33107 [Prunus yedoensis var. nudiflora]|uniref:Uncharacterized protein n=1 Tax=Prunus yedoensis var. nudiflora TaxID=2094558 RepID=A0A314UR94_PRUYE|nr:hypothetical protein Pyn_33107 [Prunus yedoensis var. nudiflora]